MSKFNYQQSSVDEIAAHFLTVTRQAVWLVKRYYKNDDITLQKILQAEKAAKLTQHRANLFNKLQEMVSK